MADAVDDDEGGEYVDAASEEHGETGRLETDPCGYGEWWRPV